MANPCGLSSKEDARWNEYIELYNYQDTPVDVGGWWLSDGEAGDRNPDQLVAWGERFPEQNLGEGVETGTTVIPAQGFAIVLPPAYLEGKKDSRMPYTFPPKTILLTLAHSNYLGSERNGLETSKSVDPLILYIGSESRVNQLISSYGAPKMDDSPFFEKSSGKNKIPIQLGDCHAAERGDPTAADSVESWRETDAGTPGWLGGR
jgi:hypothetical protein